MTRYKEYGRETKSQGGIMTRYKEYQDWYHINEVDCSPTYLWYVFIALASLIIGYFMYGCEDTQPKAVKQAPELTQQQTKYKEFFVKHGSPNPEQMAVAVTATKRPALMAAIAVKESNGNPQAVGDGGDSKGAFQVQEKHWGKVSNNPVDQALQAERILEELLSSRRSLRSGLARYNGGDRPPKVSYRYADHVIKLERKAK